MPVPARILRDQADNHRGNRPIHTTRERERHTRILTIAQEIMAIYGRGSITFGLLAIALHMSTGTLRRHFTDLDSILGTLLSDHLMAICRAMGTVPFDAPDRRAAQRAAYRSATQTCLGAPTEAHLLLVEQRQNLPPDLRHHIEELRANIGDMLAGEHGAVALTLLDTPELLLPQIETMLATLPPGYPVQTKAVSPVASPQPAPPPSKPPTPALIPRTLARPPKPFALPPIAKPDEQYWPSPSLQGPSGQMLGARAGPT